MKKEFYLSFIPPSKANRVKINLRAYSKSGKRYIVPKDVSLKINKAIWELQNQHDGETFSKPVEVDILFILPNKRRRDLDNIMKTLGDCLVYAGIIKDDNLIYRQVLEKIVVKGEEGVIIKIKEHKEKSTQTKVLEKLKKYKESVDGI
ncbi:RusA family crossover junction endodeoxyribonuclease [Persephonella sp.]|uniref:RusA family crossover junction endodeoxyribonuclease n=1 Tax=Persephonella sp. TaxID=2060922 RepID=UPI002638FF6E|nr:RusA family crossover junction endodeoxyribonuclease [Persephonella sp.]